MQDMELNYYAQKIAETYISGKTKNLKTAFNYVIEDSKLASRMNTEQKKRLLERSNRATFQALYEKDKQAALKFPLLDPADVIKEKTASKPRINKDYIIPPSKDLKEHYLPPSVKEAVDKWFVSDSKTSDNSINELSTNLLKLEAATNYLAHKKSAAAFNLEDSKEEFYEEVRRGIKYKDFDLCDLFTVFGADKVAELKPRLITDGTISELQAKKDIYKVACEVDTDSRLIKAAILEKKATEAYLDSSTKLLKLRQLKKEADQELRDKINNLGVKDE